MPFIPGLLEAAYAAGRTGRHLIVVWMDGGMSHLDTLDPKPSAGADIRGPLEAVRSSLDGAMVTEPLSGLGKLLDRCCVVRSITSPEGNHDRGSHYMLTGRRPSPLLTFPSLGSLVARTVQPSSGVPAYVAIPEAHEYARQGYLPARFGPFDVGGDPGRPDFSVRDLDPSPGLESTLSAVEMLRAIQGGPRSKDEASREFFLGQAQAISTSRHVRDLFDLNKERPEIRQAYGRHRLGQSCLLARRLVEGGVRVVLVRDQGWDHHVNIGQALTYGFPPRLTAMNQALSELILDLERRGLSEKVTLLLATEFGRTPRLNPSGGRDHWSRASSCLLFGAGIRRGQLIGETDDRGEEPVFQPVSPADVFATLLRAMGLPADERLQSPDGRPVPVIDPHATLIEDMLA